MTHEEAINIVKTQYPHDSVMKEALGTLIPELRESEDERIRKELKEAFESYDIESKWNGIPIRSIFAWLEKHKEQKPAWKPREEQLNALNFAITYFMHETNYKNPTELRDLYEHLKKLM